MLNILNRLIIILIFSLGSLSAQSFVGKLNPSPVKNQLKEINSLRILAVMVEFQEDKNTTTVGNGKFESLFSKDYGSEIIDPLPHNAEYFEQHLLFAKNYFGKNSKGKLTIEYNVLPDIYTVSKDMKEYSPLNPVDDFTPLGEFSEEVWSLVDSESQVDFNNYDLFVIFHAGVGRDISVPGSIGNEKDLPSVYLSSKSLKEIFGDSFDGFQVGSQTKKITNTLILPETENREIETIVGTTLLELSINGLTVASIASHLGLPDLFNTETGLSAIGRFGLMDGQSIFAYSGIFPPQPSAWEKIYLGWTEPTEIDITESEQKVRAALNSETNVPEIIKIRINSSEYFLIENRNRDADGDGINIQYVQDGNILTKTFIKDTTGFRSWGVDTLGGVVLDIDDYDWAVPGSGIAIWHIDENIINNNLESNTINNDILNRGVDLEEADGVQDIGVEFTTITGEVVIGEGWLNDLWFTGNQAELFENEFSDNSNPSTRTTSNSRSFLKLFDFSESASVMSFKLADRKTSVVDLFEQIKLTNDDIDNLMSITSTSKPEIYFSNGEKSFQLNIEDKKVNEFSDSFSVLPAAISIDGKNIICFAFENSIEIHFDDKIITYDLTDNKKVTAPLVISNSNGTNIFAGFSDGSVLKFELDIINDELKQSPEKIFEISEPVKNIIITQNNELVISGIKKLKFEANVVSLDNEINQIAYIEEADYPLIVLSGNSKFEKYNSDLNKLKFYQSDSAVIDGFSITDPLADGNNYIVFSENYFVNVVNTEGYLSENFPVKGRVNELFELIPLISDLDNDSQKEIISFSQNGKILVYDIVNGELKDDYSFESGSKFITQPVMFNLDGKNCIATIDQNNYMNILKFEESSFNYDWSSKYYNSNNNALVEIASAENSEEKYFPDELAYNWPNPVYDNETHFRYYVSEDSDVKITIFDLSGDLVAELSDHANGGMDNETTWNVSQIQSGVYFASLEVTSNSGNSSSKIIKVAIIK